MSEFKQTIFNGSIEPTANDDFTPVKSRRGKKGKNSLESGIPEKKIQSVPSSSGVTGSRLNRIQSAKRQSAKLTPLASVVRDTIVKSDMTLSEKIASIDAEHDVSKKLPPTSSAPVTIGAVTSSSTSSEAVAIASSSTSSEAVVVTSSSASEPVAVAISSSMPDGMVVLSRNATNKKSPTPAPEQNIVQKVAESDETSVATSGSHSSIRSDDSRIKHEYRCKHFENVANTLVLIYPSSKNGYFDKPSNYVTDNIDSSLKEKVRKILTNNSESGHRMFGSAKESISSLIRSISSNSKIKMPAHIAIFKTYMMLLHQAVKNDLVSIFVYLLGECEKRKYNMACIFNCYHDWYKLFTTAVWNLSFSCLEIIVSKEINDIRVVTCNVPNHKGEMPIGTIDKSISDLRSYTSSMAYEKIRRANLCKTLIQGAIAYEEGEFDTPSEEVDIDDI
jgi:hypothetical protein